MTLETFNQKFYEFETTIVGHNHRQQTIRFRVPISDKLALSIRQCLEAILVSIHHRPIEPYVADAIDQISGPMWTSNIDQRLLDKPYVIIA